MSSSDFSKPIITDNYLVIPDEIRALFQDLSKWLDATTQANTPTSAKRWNSSNKCFEVFDGTNWGPLADAYQINVDKVDGKDASDFATADHNHDLVYQKIQANLGALAGLTGAADTAIYFTGEGTMNVFSISSYCRALLGSISEGSFQAYVQLTPGMDIMAFSEALFDLQNAVHFANVASLSGLNSAEDTIPYFTGSGTFGITACTTVARNLMAATTAAQQRDVLGLGTAAVLNASDIVPTDDVLSGAAVANFILNGGF